MKEKYIRNNFTKNIYRGRRRKRFVSRQIVRLTVLLFLCLCAIMVLGFSWKESLKKEGAFQIPAISFGDNAPAADIHGEQGTAEKPAQASAVQGGEPQASDTDVPWQLTLVNQHNPIPDNYEPDLVQAPGGESVDKRIYEPLMQMLEAAREGKMEEADGLLAEGEKQLAKAHNAQTELLTAEAQGKDIAYSIMLIHAQDHLMTTIMYERVAKEFIVLYKEKSGLAPCSQPHISQLQTEKGM